MATRTVRFQEVKWPVTKSVACFRCGRGRKIRRSRTFVQTVNPWNVLKTGPRAGQAKTVADILIELREQADKWTPLAAHPPCKCPAFTELPTITSEEADLLAAYADGPYICYTAELQPIVTSLEKKGLITLYTCSAARALTRTGRTLLDRLSSPKPA